MDIALYKQTILEIKPNARTEKYISKHYPDIYNYIITSYPSIKFAESVYLFLHDLTSQPVCFCGKPVSFRNSVFGYNTFCSQTCANADNTRVEKILDTKLQRYGDASFNNRDKSKETTLKRYGVENVFQSKEVQTRIKNTNKKLYGVEYPSQSIEVQNTIIQNNLKKYGVERVQSLDTVKDKIKKSYQNNYIKNHPDILSYTNEGNWVCKCPHNDCTKCKEKTYEIGAKQYFARREYSIEPCTRLLEISQSRNQNTWIEKFVKNILEEYNIQYIENDRSILSGLELDIYIPDKNIAIECNGCYWHSDTNKDIKYHYNKFALCKNNGIQLISIWEDQIINTPEIVKSVLLSKLRIYSKRIYARQCIIKEINSNTASNFLVSNHIQGKTKTKVRLGLYYNDELIGVMTFNNRSKLSGGKNDDCWELNRFCTTINTQVVGGAEKLLKYFERTYKPSKLISFSSNDISIGTVYDKLGFKTNGTTQSYWYVHKTSYIRYHRTSFQKSRIKQYSINEQETEKDIMMRLPYYRIYDSGHLKWIKEY